ncbi:50S ribosomal protein L9 [Pseudokineococcus lusitanus]|jgi:large subunit ribosomal protein L9|uniref:Large ribosomal subunit protein bL9 n=1 Tax=Pseudokineococcus lusitanus TaxID=763993 RepID=A0A3N1GX43_9ACTN|nr:50S ribosomal protein L9 [Pseudokineococcus lusitanus]ROP34739.1 large subunit ribosomal protein L9 [Pseudokineococcus lusitanus]
MKLILTQEVSGLGSAGEVVEVKDGYGRNFLLPRSLATPWTKGGQKQVDDIQRARRKREIASVEEAQSLRASLQETPVRLAANAGQGGRLFGAITPADVAEAVQASTGKDIDRRKVEIGRPIKALGTYTVTVRLHPDVQASLDVEVVPSA